MKSVFSSLILFLGYAFNLQAQSAWQVNLFPGYLIGHRELMANMEAHTLGAEIHYTHTRTCRSLIDSNYNSLRWGVSLSYFNLNNPQVNGEVYAAILDIEANIRTRRHSRTALRVGTGVGYLTRPFNARTNPKNSAIGSHLNGSMQLIILHQVTLNKRFELNSGLGVTHFSNGNFRKPNLGINMAHVVLGASYFLNRPDKTMKICRKPFPTRGIEVSAAFAHKQISVQDPRTFTIGIASFTYYFPHKNIAVRNWRFGPDFFFDRTDQYEEFQPSSVENLSLAKMTEIGLRAGHEFLFNNVAVITDLGLYLYKPPLNTKRRTYFSIGVSYFPFRNVVLNNRLKSHLAVADYFEWGAGYRIDSRFLRK